MYRGTSHYLLKKPCPETTPTWHHKCPIYNGQTEAYREDNDEGKNESKDDGKNDDDKHKDKGKDECRERDIGHADATVACITS